MASIYNPAACIKVLNASDFFPDFYKDNFTAALQRPKIVKNTTVIIKKKILKEFYAFYASVRNA